MQNGWTLWLGPSLGHTPAASWYLQYARQLAVVSTVVRDALI